MADTVMTLWICVAFILMLWTIPSLSSTACRYSRLQATGTSMGSIINSPDYPSSYPPNVCLCWIYQGPPGTLFTLKLLDIEMPGRSDACTGDVDSIMIGPTKRRRLCGTSAASNGLYRIVLTKANPLVFVIFNSSASKLKGRGFRAEYHISFPVSTKDRTGSNVLVGSVNDSHNVSPSNDGNGDVDALVVSGRSGHSIMDNREASACGFILTDPSGSIYLNTSILKLFRLSHVCRWTIESGSKYSRSSSKRGEHNTERIRLWFRNCGLGPTDMLTIVDTDGSVVSDVRAEHCPNVVESKGDTMQVVLKQTSPGVSGVPVSLVLYYMTVPGPDEGSHVITPTPRGNKAFDLTPDCDYVLANVTSGAISGPSETAEILRRCGGQLSWLVTAAMPTEPFITSTLRFQVKLENCPSGNAYPQDTVEVFDGSKSSTHPLLSCDAHGRRSRRTNDHVFLVRYHTFNPDSPRQFRLSFTRESSLCPGGSYSCRQGGQYCYNEKDRCNGIGTCTNYMDEMDCDTSMCNADKGLFLCANKRCIYERWQCDGHSDCDDDSDEAGCPTLTTPRVIVAATVGCLVCSLMLVIALSCVCKKYRVRQLQMMGGISSSGERAPCECGGGAGRYESPLSREIAEMFRHRPPPPPYNEAMLTSRPYSEAAMLQVMPDGTGGASQGLVVSQSQQRRSLSGAPPRDTQNPTHSERSSASNSNPRRSGRRSSRRQHRQVVQQASVTAGAPTSSNSSPAVASQVNSGFIEVGSLALLGSENPPPYSLSDPLRLAGLAEEEPFNNNDDGDNDASSFTEEGDGSIQLRPQRRSGGVGHQGSVSLSPSARDEGDSESVPSSTEVSLQDGGSGVVDFECVKEDEEQGSQTGDVSVLSSRLGVVEDESDDECILVGDDDEDKNDNDDNDLDDEDEDAIDSDESDTACLLSAV